MAVEAGPKEDKKRIKGNDRKYVFDTGEKLIYQLSTSGDFVFTPYKSKKQIFYWFFPLVHTTALP